jgi:hypothetical protein
MLFPRLCQSVNELFSSAPQGQPLKSECKSTLFPTNSKTYAALFPQKHIRFNSRSRLNGRTHYYIIRHAKEGTEERAAGHPAGTPERHGRGRTKHGPTRSTTQDTAKRNPKDRKTQRKTRQNAKQKTAIPQNGQKTYTA